MNPHIIERETEDYRKLEMVAKMLEMVSPNHAMYRVEDIYFDYGQNWMWTTICRRGFAECQVLSPREWTQILFSEGLVELAEAAEEIRRGKYFMDV